MTGTFRLISFDEDGDEGHGRGVRVGPNGDHRLVCNIERDGKIAIWGKKHSRRNIDSVLNAVKNAGFPCDIQCEYRPPEPWAEEYCHTHWVPENGDLHILEG